MTEQELLSYLYWDNGLTKLQIGVLLGISGSTISRRMKKYGIASRTKSENAMGENNSMFGKHHSQNSKEKMSKTQKEAITPAKIEFLRQEAIKAWKNEEYRNEHINFAKVRTGDKNSFFGKSHTNETKHSISLANRGRFIGDNGSNWQGGKTKLSMTIRENAIYKEWRKDIFDRDKYTCQSCGRVGGDLHAHHKIPFSLLMNKYEIKTLEDALKREVLWDRNNGITLCMNCHRRTDTFAGKVAKL